MRPHPRIRKTIKWGGAAVTVLLVVVWVGSLLKQGGLVFSNGSELKLGYGRMELLHAPKKWGSVIPVGIWTQPTYPSGSNIWYFRWEAQRGELLVTIPLWVAVGGVALITAIASHLGTLARRRAKLNLCPKCNYDRTGLASKDAKCPECGAAASASAGQ